MPDPEGTGGTGGGVQATGGSTATGGRATGGSTTGGNTGGASPRGGSGGNVSATGGTATGGSATGGKSSPGDGGSTTGGAGGKNVAGNAGGAAGGRGGAATSTGGAGQGGALGGRGGAPPQGGSSGGYAPCPTDGSPCVILPFGDSITDGVGSTDAAGYRSPLFKLVVADAKNITFVGSRSSGPAQVSGKTFPKKHEGHPGWTIDPGYVSYGDGISKLIPSPAFDTIPHIVLLMIGTNDVNSTMGLDTMANRLDVLLGKIVAAAPNALIVVAAPTPLRAGSSALTNYIAKVPGVVQARAAKGQHLVAVDMSKMPVSNLGSDGIHPNDTGYSYMAGIWYAALKGLLPPS